MVFLATLFTATPFQASFAKLYKWVDDDGNVTYSQNKPPDRKADTLKLRGVAPPTQPAATADKAASEQGATQPPTGESAAAAGDAAASNGHGDRFKQNCETARQNLRLLDSAPRLTAQDAEGKPYYLSAQQIDQKKAQANEHVKLYCK